MKKLVFLLATLTLLFSRSAHAQGAVAGKVLGKLVIGSLNNVIGNEASSVLTNLGVFSMLGLGSGTDPVLNAKLDEIINQLQVVQADITDLQNDVATLTNTVVQQSAMVQLQSLLHDMQDAQNSILLCAQQVVLVAQTPGTDATDMQMQSFALQMVGRAAGPCDLTNQFSIIDSRIVTDQTLGSAESAFYSLLAQVARASNIDYEPIASHFVQFAITQREALELIRGAYSALGEADNLQTVLTMPPTNFLAKLHDEEVAFLQATDTYITAGSPPYDTSPAALADAIVQRLESVPKQATTYSLSLLDDAGAFSPVIAAPSTATTPQSLPMAGTIAGATSTYYDTGDAQLTAGLGSCLASPPTPGFSYVRPMGGTGGGFKIGSSCTLHVERHLLQNVPAAVGQDWTIGGRYGSTPIGPLTLRNAATLNPETAADALALAGDPGGRGSGFSAFTIAPQASDPSTVVLTIDLPGQPGTPISFGTTHPLVAAPGGAVVPFTRIPYGPQYPDRYALDLGGQYLSVDANGFAAMSDTPTWFDFQRTLDGHTELDYAGGVLYVDNQYVQIFHGESPDDVWANSVNAASGTAAIAQWALPMDGVPRTRPTSALSIYPPCLDGNGNGVFATMSLGPGLTFPSTECSDDGLAYVAYQVTFYNDDSFDRALQITLSGQAILPSGQTEAEAGIHCYAPAIGSPDDHLDAAAAEVSTTMMNADTPVEVFNPSNRTLTVPANGSLEIVCQILDTAGTAADLIVNQFVVQPCKGAAGGTCAVYP
ncbi:MAG TPA: hypothetical protein VI456_13325 [Polyangia bacterium]